MVNRVVELLSDCPDGVFVDSTVGSGGHLIEVFKAHGSKFKYFGFDLDGLVLEETKKVISKTGIKAELVKSNFSEVVNHLNKRNISSISAILYDLGIGSFQVDDPERGFSYLGSGPLSMSFDDKAKLSASDLINKLSEKELTDLFRVYGQERRAKLLSKAIKQYPGKLTTTNQLAEVIRSVVGNRYFVKTASRVFQAIRIKVNDEFENIRKGIESVLPYLSYGGRVIVITYHSLEDGLVKRIFKKFTGKCVCSSRMKECRCGKEKLVRLVLTKPIKADPDEVAVNVRARSAKLRVVEKIAVVS